MWEALDCEKTGIFCLCRRYIITRTATLKAPQFVKFLVNMRWICEKSGQYIALYRIVYNLEILRPAICSKQETEV